MGNHLSVRRPQVSTVPADERPIIISGPSSVGKEQLIELLIKRHPDVFGLAISHTTRRPRDGEVDGESYHFVCANEFESAKNKGEFFEYTIHNGNYYGTSRSAVEYQQANGKIPILNIDVHGADKLKRDTSLAMRYIFIEPDTWEVENTLLARGVGEQEIRNKLARAKVDVQSAWESGSVDIHIINDIPEMAYARLLDFLFGR